MGLPKTGAQHFSYADYCQWPEDERFELIDGVAHAMGPAPLRRHQVFAGEIFRQIANALKGKPCQPFIAPFDVRLPKADRADDKTDTVVQPDISVVCDPKKLDERGCNGAPDWVIEVISPATASHDHILKRQVYERAGVQEYWIVHPVDRMVTVYRLIDGAYQRPDVYELTGTLASLAVPAAVVDWSELAAE
ncbi:MAG: Uma2 family endonuclease [Rhodocyclaceae bacterium]|jgi:Uma2 family endonuclease|nr:Uma2 family endonuclease [Rhodocyclaceae bacterium]